MKCDFQLDFVRLILDFYAVHRAHSENFKRFIHLEIFIITFY